MHPKAMPVILTASDEYAAWTDLPWDGTKALQRPLRHELLVRVEGSDGKL